jgi:hypothetical protein
MEIAMHRRRPPPESPRLDSRYWRLRAEATRTLAAETASPSAKARLLKVAEEYRRLATSARTRVTAGSTREAAASLAPKRIVAIVASRRTRFRANRPS